MKIFDLETDNLLDKLTTIHCGVVYDTETGKYTRYYPDDVHRLWQDLANAEDGVVAHNGLEFDLEALNKIYGDSRLFQLFYQKCHRNAGTWFFDTLILSRLFYPDILPMDYASKKPFGNLAGSHSLKAWGVRLGVHKGAFGGTEESFEHFSEEMMEYNEQDVRVTNHLFDRMVYRMEKLSNGMCVELEHQFATYLKFQQIAGVGFDRQKAEFLVSCWRKELAKRIVEMRARVSDILVEEEFIPKRDNRTKGYKAGVPTIKRKVVPFNPRSGDHIIFLFTEKYKWKPVEFTNKKSEKWPNGKPQVTHDVLVNLDYPEAPLLARIKLLQDRIALVEGSAGSWVKSINPDTDRIHGRIIHNGTPTSRCRHSKPNLGNIPSPRATWGKTLRSLFKAREGFKLVGCDADGLEMRVLSHYLYPFDNGAFFEMAFNGSKAEGTDAHSLNMKAIQKLLGPLGLPCSRDAAKTIFYALIYGAWPKRLALTLMKEMGLDLPQNKQYYVGTIISEAIRSNIAGLDALIATLEEDFEASEGWPHLYMPDGRPAPIRSKHSILNTACQTLGAVIIKLATVLFARSMEAHGLIMMVDWFPVLHVHDELQVEVKDEGENIETAKRLASSAISRAGELLGLRVPLVGHSESGLTWAETH